MELIPFKEERDFDIIKDWITDPRTHALWCGGRFEYPLRRENFESVLREMSDANGETPFIAADGDGRAAGFLCFSVNAESNEAMLKFIVAAPELRGKGAAGEMLRLAAELAFDKAGAGLLQLMVFSGNPRAKRCYEKAGFETRQVYPGAFAFGDENWDRINMILKNGR